LEALLCIRKKKKKKLPYLNKIKFYLEMNALVDAIRSLSQKFYFSDKKLEASSSSSSSGYKAKLETSSAIALTWRL
jgi:hypothetical protein